VRRGGPGMPGNHDFPTRRVGIVPRDQRRPMWHFIGLWTTLVADFSFMVPRFVMYDGASPSESRPTPAWPGYGIYMADALVGSYLGAQTGQTLTLLTRAVFGRIGSWLVSLLVMIPALGWVGFQAGVLVRLRHGFYGWPQPAAITVALAAVMIFNNLFGFAGISLFALPAAGRMRRAGGLDRELQDRERLVCRPGFLAITAPCATMIMAVDRFVLPRLLGVSRPAGRVPSWRQAAVANWSAIASLMTATVYGAIASAIVPVHLGFSDAWNWGRYHLSPGSRPAPATLHWPPPCGTGHPAPSVSWAFPWVTL
jgi:hypothetical protein